MIQSLGTQMRWTPAPEGSRESLPPPPTSPCSSDSAQILQSDNSYTFSETFKPCFGNAGVTLTGDESDPESCPADRLGSLPNLASLSPAATT